MSKHYLVRPFSSLTFGAVQKNDFGKAGHNPDNWQWFKIRVLYSDYSAAATTEELNLDDLANALVAAGSSRVSGAIPTDALFGMWTYSLKQVFAGGSVSAATMTSGPASGDADGFLTSTNVFTGATLGRKRTSGAALWAMQPLSADPALTLNTTTANINTLTSGCMDVFCRWTLDPEEIPFP